MVKARQKIKMICRGSRYVFENFSGYYFWEKLLKDERKKGKSKR
jgi:hypothetical protein